MYPLALLPLELVLAGLAVAQSTAECTRYGLTKLNNQLGQSPCTVQKQLQQACGDDETPARNCTCNTVMYNIGAACAACSGDDIPPWSSWADQNTCNSSPAQFSLPSNVKVDISTIPRWAYQQLSAQHDFNLQEAIEEPESDGGLSRAAQVAVPISVAVGVTLLAVLVFWWYLRRQRRRYLARPRSQNISDGANLLTEPVRWFRELKLSMHSHRLRTSRKDTSWEIDDDSHLLVSRSDTPYHDPYSSEDRAHTPSRSGRDSRASYVGSHTRAGSSLSMLSNIEFPEVRVPTFMERFIKFKDGIRKSASYKAKHVSPVSPDQSFRIDGEEAPPLPPKYHTVSDFRTRPNASLPSFSEERQKARAARPTPLEVVVERSDHDPQSEHGHDFGAPGMGTDDVLIISRDGGDNFTINDTATTATGSPRTPSTRQPPSAYSAARTMTATTLASPGLTATRSSWLPSPRRANTSSTVSGAYPHELRRDPDLVAPPSWANKFPDPPQTSVVYPQGQVHSARTLPTPPGPQKHTQMLSPPHPESARTF